MTSVDFAKGVAGYLGGKVCALCDVCTSASLRLRGCDSVAAILAKGLR